LFQILVVLSCLPMATVADPLNKPSGVLFFN
jgi:hypothetical protein